MTPETVAIITPSFLMIVGVWFIFLINLIDANGIFYVLSFKIVPVFLGIFSIVWSLKLYGVI